MSVCAARLSRHLFCVVGVMVKVLALDKGWDKCRDTNPCVTSFKKRGAWWSLPPVKQHGQSVATPEQGTAQAELGHRPWHCKGKELSGITQSEGGTSIV